MEETGKTWIYCIEIVKLWMRITPHKTTKITPFEALYGRPYYLPLFHQAIGEDDGEMTLAEHMTKTLQNKEVLRANCQNLFSPQETDDLVTEGEYMWVKRHRRKSGVSHTGNSNAKFS